MSLQLLLTTLENLSGKYCVGDIQKQERENALNLLESYQNYSQDEIMGALGTLLYYTESKAVVEDFAE